MGEGQPGAERITSAPIRSFVLRQGRMTPAQTRAVDTLFGRYGIPFNAIYSSGSPRGQALPELLTTATVLEQLNQALAAGNDRLARVEAPDPPPRQPEH